jgi:hypothetical protein
MPRWFVAAICLSALVGCPSTDKPDDTSATNNDDVIGPVDEDGDGYLVSEGDCDDADARVNPAAIEICDGIDNDCDGEVDEGVATIFYTDADGDGFGDDATATGYCEPPDGYTLVGGDCDDTDPAFHPNAEEPCTEDVDYDCDGVVAYADDDGDGFAACEDCDDLDPAVNPDATEVCNGIDDDCDGEADPTSSFDVEPYYEDTDGDGYGDPDAVTEACAAPPGYVADATDCDDTRTDVNPGATEVCDADDVDEDCDTLADDDDDSVDPSTYSSWFFDSDGDSYGADDTEVIQCDPPAGYLAAGGDCNDASGDFYPGAPETDCTDPNDYNCDGSVAYVDADGDLWAACAECDDSNPAVNPGATEVCNGIDDDCDGVIDPDSATDAATWYADTDGDGYGDATASTASCSAPSGFVADDTDCDDTDSAVSPAGIEWCNGTDDDCDGVVDPSTSADAATWYADADGDTYGDAAVSVDACDVPAGFVADDTDCDDSVKTTFPGATEFCNGVDDDCDGVIDPDSAWDALTWYADTDGDAYGDPASTTLACSQPAGYVADNTDCDDTAAGVNPGVTEVCDPADTDENCNGLADDADPSTDPSSASTWYVDGDGDGYGDAATSFTGCEQPAGYLVDDTDCDDTRSGVHPGATEYCDALDVDEDCDGLADDDDPSVDTSTYDTFYIDADGDCDDADPTINPAAAEVCDGLDNDCDGLVDTDTTSGDACCGDAGFDGTYGASWSRLATAPNYLFSLMTFKPDDFDYVWNAYGSKLSYYDPSSNTWASVASSTPCTGTWNSMAPYDGNLWMIRCNKVYKYDVSADSWSTMGTYVGSDDANQTVATCDGKIYGHTGSGTIVEYDVDTATVTQYVTGKGGQYETRMAYDPTEDAVYFGRFSAGNWYKFDVTTHTVSTMTSHPERYLNDIVCGDWSGHIYAAGGSSGTSLYQYTTATDTWAAITPFPIDHGNNGSCTVGTDGYLYMADYVKTSFYRLALY